LTKHEENPGNGKPPSISVIIPTLNEEESIETCLRSVRNQTVYDFELILSDGESDDKTVEASRRYVDKIIVSSNRGIGTQQNLGAKFAEGGILVFIHADTIVGERLLEEISGATNDGYIGGGCVVKTVGEGYKCKLFDEAIKLINVILNPFNILCTGEVLFFRKDVFMKNEGFRDVFFEDADMLLRARDDGKLKLLKSTVVTSGRRFREGFWKKMIFEWVPYAILTLLGRPRKMKYIPAR